MRYGEGRWDGAAITRQTASFGISGPSRGHKGHELTALQPIRNQVDQQNCPNVLLISHL